MPDLEHDLRALAAEVEWPATPNLARRWNQMATPPVAIRLHRRLLVALAAALLLVPSAALALPAPRHAILDALGLRHVRVERRPTVPVGHDPHLGARTTAAGAARALGGAPLLPAALGAPDRLYAIGSIVTAVYDRDHVLLAQAGGALQGDILRKVVSVDDRVRRVRVAGRPGLWLAAGHAYAWTDATGGPVRSGAALVWERDGRVLRLEGPRSVRTALRLAETIR
jgi:hypothetical protein